MDVGEAERLQPPHRPFPRPGLGLGAGRAGADLGRQPLDDVAGDLVLQRRVAKALGLVEVLGEGGRGADGAAAASRQGFGEAGGQSRPSFRESRKSMSTPSSLIRGGSGRRAARW